MSDDVSTLEIGQVAPDFELPSDAHGDVRLSAFKGKTVVIYFYPRDNTPGCTTEACDFRDRMDRVEASGAVVLGISRDTVGSHERFRQKQSLNFPLLSDRDGTVHKLFAAWGEKKLYGKVSIGPIRSTVLIDGEGIVRQHWPKVRVKGHAEDVIAAVEALKAEG
ncbi:MAG: thioredoxin-dependent thiol peroxidase [Bradymonadia bacterium]